MSKDQSTAETLSQIQKNGGSVKFNFENGSSQVQNMNKEIFFNEKGRPRDSNEIISILKDTGHDLGAVYFELQT